MGRRTTFFFLSSSVKEDFRRGVSSSRIVILYVVLNAMAIEWVYCTGSREDCGCQLLHSVLYIMLLSSRLAEAG